MKSTVNVLLLALIILVLASAVTYGIAFKLKLPLPLINDGTADINYDEQNRLMESWEEVRIYKPQEGNLEDLTKETIVGDITEGEFFSLFSELDKDTFENNIGDALEEGYSKLLIDKVDKENTPTGIKTIQGDDVLAIDTHDGIMIVGIDVNGQKGKLAILKYKEQIGYSVVDDLTYWDTIEKHAEKENALLAINANGYTWNQTGNYGTIYGLAVRNDVHIRRVRDKNNIIGFNQEGDLIIGKESEELYNACEYGPKLIDGGVRVDKGDGVISARTAIGQTEDGDIILLVVDGDRNSKGAGIEELADIMEKYGAVNASNLSGGICSIMWWNGRVVSNPHGEELGVRLPTTWIVRQAKRELKDNTDGGNSDMDVSGGEDTLEGNGENVENVEDVENVENVEVKIDIDLDE